MNHSTLYANLRTHSHTTSGVRAVSLAGSTVVASCLAKWGWTGWRISVLLSSGCASSGMVEYGLDECRVAERGSIYFALPMTVAVIAGCADEKECFVFGVW